MIFPDSFIIYILFCACSFAMLQLGLTDGWPSFALPQLQSNSSKVVVTNDEGSWIVSTFPIGTIFGSLLLSFTFDKFGRKIILLVGSLLFCAIWALIAFGQTFWQFGVARFVAGISDGLIYPIILVYITEVSRPKIRGVLITGTKISYVAGILIINLLDEFFSRPNVAIISSVLLCGVLLCLFVPESPYFYLIKNDYNTAKKSLEIYNRSADIETIQNALTDQKSNGRKWSDLFTERTNRRRLYLMTIAKIFQQFTGFITFVYYAQTIFLESKNDVNPIIFASIYNSLQILVLIINAMVIDKFGRKPLLTTSSSIVALALIIISSYFTVKNVTEINVNDYTWCPILGSFLFIVGYTLGLQNVLDLVVSEIFPLHVKTVAVSIHNAIYGLSIMAVSKFFQYAKDEYGIHVPFIVFAIFSICSVPFFIVFIPETKKKTLEDVEKCFRKKLESNVN
ncbi:hypothetical protein FQR65_LT07565 [Abscondita terminalis]|nr:hypothetical protein FQR65_LT07565 [Abscondita terminalis]